MMKYVLREPLTIKNAKKADPEAIGKALEKIKAANNDKLKPRYVWQAAKDNPRHPLYKHFEWNVELAAEAHWDSTARTLITCIRIEDDDKPDSEPAIAFFSVNKGGSRYVSRDDVFDNRELQLLVMKNAERDLIAWERRYRELSDLCEAIKLIRERLAARREEAELRQH
jgi:hypothetical protein